MGFCIPSCSAPNEPSFESPGKPWQGLKGKNPRLQHQSEQFWVAQKPTNGRRRPEQEGIQIPFVRRIICCVRKCKHKLQVLFGPPGVQKTKKEDLQNQACYFFLIACYPILIPDSEST